MNEEQFEKVAERAAKHEKITRQEFEDALEYALFRGMEEMPEMGAYDWLSTIRILYRATE